MPFSTPAARCAVAVLLLSAPFARARDRHAAASATPAPAASPSATPAPLITSEVSGKDLQFLTDALGIGQVLNWLSDQAAKAESPQIQAIGEALRSTQAEQSQQLTQLAKSKGCAPGPSAASAALVRKLAREFAKLSGLKFDKAVIEQIVEVERREVATYESATASADAEIKSFAESGLPLAKEKLNLCNAVTGNSPHDGTVPAFRNGVEGLSPR